MEIVFVGGCKPTAAGGAVEFWADRDGQPIRCVITSEALFTYYRSGGPGRDLQAYETNADDIQRVAAAMIRDGLAGTGGQLIIKESDVRARRGGPPA